jgi:CDP-diacylglycerol--serine O-phosphatidyltransferase
MPKTTPALKEYFFTGVPAPAAAVLALSPLMVSFDFKASWFQSPWVIAGIVICVSLLMVSRIPTFAFKGLKVSQAQVAPALLLVAIMIAGLLSAPWITVLILCVIYVLLIPISWRKYKAMNLPVREEIL